MAIDTPPSKTRSPVAIGTAALVFGIAIGWVIGNWDIGILLGIVIMIQLITRSR